MPKTHRRLTVYLDPEVIRTIKIEALKRDLSAGKILGLSWRDKKLAALFASVTKAEAVIPRRV